MMLFPACFNCLYFCHLDSHGWLRLLVWHHIAGCDMDVAVIFIPTANILHGSILHQCDKGHLPAHLLLCKPIHDCAHHLAAKPVLLNLLLIVLLVHEIETLLIQVLFMSGDIDLPLSWQQAALDDGRCYLFLRQSSARRGVVVDLGNSESSLLLLMCLLNISTQCSIDYHLYGQ